MKALRFLVCFAVSFVCVYLIGKLASDIVYATPILSFVVAVFVFSVLAFVLLEMCLKLKNKIYALSYRVEQLEETLNSNKK